MTYEERCILDVALRHPSIQVTTMGTLGPYHLRCDVCGALSSANGYGWIHRPMCPVPGVSRLLSMYDGRESYVEQKPVMKTPIEVHPDEWGKWSIA